MNYLKKNLHIILIILLTVFLRLNYDIFIAGYTFDEIAIVSVAKLNFFDILAKTAQIDYHAPFYYLLIHPLTGLENEWVYLRLLNIVFSIINVFIFYKIGCEIKNKNTGLILALILAVNHMQISTVAFVKFYCWDFLLFSLIILFFIKYIKKEKYSIPLAVANIFFILSSTLGVFIVLFEYLVLYFIKQDKKRVLISFLISMSGFLLYMPILAVQVINAFDNIISPHGTYPDFSPFGIYAFINDYVSPLVNYSCVAESVEANALLLSFLKGAIYYKKFDYISLAGFIILSLIPVIICIFGFINGWIKHNKIKILSYVVILNISFFILLTLFEITGFIPVYMYPAGLIVLISSIIGVCEIKNKKLKISLILYLVISQLVVTNYYPIAKRDDTRQKIYIAPIKYAKNTDKNTVLIATLGGRFLIHYLNQNNVFNFDYEQIGGSKGRDYIRIIYGDNISENANKKNYKNLFSNFILNKRKSPGLEKYFADNVVSKMNKKDKLVYMFYADDCSFIAKDTARKTILDKNYSYHLEDSSLIYQLTKPENSDTVSETFIEDIVRSYSNELLIGIIEKYYKRTKIEHYEINYSDGNFYKVFESENFSQSTLWLMENALYGWFFITYEKI